MFLLIVQYYNSGHDTYLINLLKICLTKITRRRESFFKQAFDILLEPLRKNKFTPPEDTDIQNENEKVGIVDATQILEEKQKKIIQNNLNILSNLTLHLIEFVKPFVIEFSSFKNQFSHEKHLLLTFLFELIEFMSFHLDMYEKHVIDIVLQVNQLISPYDLLYITQQDFFRNDQEENSEFEFQLNFRKNNSSPIAFYWFFVLIEGVDFIQFPIGTLSSEYIFNGIARPLRDLLISQIFYFLPYFIDLMEYLIDRMPKYSLHVSENVWSPDNICLSLCQVCDIVNPYLLFCLHFL